VARQTGKNPTPATALAVPAITRHGKRVRFYSTGRSGHLLEREKHERQSFAPNGRACFGLTPR